MSTASPVCATLARRGQMATAETAKWPMADNQGGPTGPAPGMSGGDGEAGGETVGSVAPQVRAPATGPAEVRATFMYMPRTVGIAELRQNLSRYLAMVAKGERLTVTDRNRPVAELGPPPTEASALDRLIAEGRVSAPRRRSLPAPLEMGGDPRALSRALDEIRGER